MESAEPPAVTPDPVFPVVYTFVEQIRRHGHDPHAYFEWVFGKLMHDPGPDELPELLPAAWIAAQPTRERESAAKTA